MTYEDEGQSIMDREFDATERAKERKHELDMAKVGKKTGSTEDFIFPGILVGVMMLLSSVVTCNVADGTSDVELRECRDMLRHSR